MTVSVTTGRTIAARLGNNWPYIKIAILKIIRSLTQLGLKVGEEAWNMPIDDSYEKDIRSDIADMKNVGSGRGAGWPWGGTKTVE